MKYSLRLLFAFGLSILPFTMNASTRTSADSAYLAGDFSLAKQLYEQTLKEVGPHPDVYFNLGNTEYRLEHAPQAILCYQRALKYAPSHREALDNLERLQLKQHIVFERPDEMFFFTYYRQFTQSLSTNVWAAWSVVMLILALICLAFVICWRSRGVRIASLIVCVLAFILSVLSANYSYSARERIENSVMAVAMQETDVKQSPSDGSKTTNQILAGTTLVILFTENNWCRVSLPDGTIGWIPAEKLEVV